MGKTALLVLFVAITIINQYKGEPNFACTGRDEYCSDSDRCQSLGGYVEKLAFKCKCGNACCKCTDTCPDGSTCMSEGETCDGMKDPNGCCGNRYCCTPTTTTTPEPCVRNCTHVCKDACEPEQIREGECCGKTCCRHGGR